MNHPNANTSPELATAIVQAFETTIARLQRFVDAGEAYLDGCSCAFCEATPDCESCPLRRCVAYIPQGRKERFGDIHYLLRNPYSNSARVHLAKEWAIAAIKDLKSRRIKYAKDMELIMNDPIGCPFCGGEIEYDEENDYHVCYGCGFQYSTDAGRDVDEAFLKRRPPFTVLVDIPEPEPKEGRCNKQCGFLYKIFNPEDSTWFTGCIKDWNLEDQYYMYPGPGCPRYKGEKK